MFDVAKLQQEGPAACGAGRETLSNWESRDAVDFIDEAAIRVSRSRFFRAPSGMNSCLICGGDMRPQAFLEPTCGGAVGAFHPLNPARVCALI